MLNSGANKVSIIGCAGRDWYTLCQYCPSFALWLFQHVHPAFLCRLLFNSIFICASHHPQAPSYSQRSDSSATANAVLLSGPSQQKPEVNFPFFQALILLVWICNPCCSWPSSWKMSIDIGNMAVNKGLTVTPLAICDTAVIISSPLISFSFSVTSQQSGFCNEPCSGLLKAPPITDQSYM